jgi:hypothetical protein
VRGKEQFVRAGISKFQIPNPKLHRNPELQIPNRALHSSESSGWVLGFGDSLRFGIWNLGFLSLLLLWFASNTLASDVVSKFLGSQSCATSMCHGGADELHNQFGIWSKKDFHTRAPATLSMARSARIAETLKISDATSEARCTVCHNPFQAVPAERKDSKVGKLEGVSCESCHSAADNWLLTHTRTDLTHEQKVAAGMRDTKNLYVRANTCVACHQNLDADIRAAGHPELIFEMDGQCVTMPRHWSETNRLRGAQAWLVGQAVALREAGAAAKEGEAGDRFAALAAVLGVDSAGLPDLNEVDALAKKTAQEQWSVAQVSTWLKKLASSSARFSGPTPTRILAPEAERTTIGIERLLVALDLHKETTLSAKLDQLFADIQSRPDFDGKKFAEHLKDFEAALPK